MRGILRGSVLSQGVGGGISVGSGLLGTLWRRAEVAGEGQEGKWRVGDASVEWEKRKGNRRGRG